ncbi:Alcohol O-acetyltransferase [Bertholletia excelsa]
MGSKGDFSLKVRNKEVVAAMLPMQGHFLPLSNLDLLLPPNDVGVFFCYKKPIAREGDSSLTLKFLSMVSVLKKALAQTLVSYYAFAGEMVQNTAGEPELLCNNRGVDFFEAFADVELRDLNLYNPDDSVQGKLVPKKEQGVLCVQATELRCGGLVVACAFDHRVADAYSANMFLVSWAHVAYQSDPVSLFPSFRRSLLSPRRPGSYHPSLHHMYVPVSLIPPPKLVNLQSNQLISRIYYIKSDQLSCLQSRASGGHMGKRRTKLEAFSALLWKMVASTEVERNRVCTMGIVVDGRMRLSDRDISSMSSYFGNVLSIPFGKERAGELMERPLSWVAETVHDFLQAVVTKEHFLDLIDYVEAHRPTPVLAKIYATGGGEDDGPAFVVSSGLRFPASKVDFGWGEPAFGSYHFPWGGQAGYVMPMPSPLGNGDWVVYMHLLKGQLEVIEAQATYLLQPFTSDYPNYSR